MTVDPGRLLVAARHRYRIHCRRCDTTCEADLAPADPLPACWHCQRSDQLHATDRRLLEQDTDD